MATTPVIQSTTQQFLDIYDITNDVIILKNGAASIVLTINAINFGLLAEAEQDAVIYQYAALLNSLNFPIQVVVRSQTKDATSYLQLLKDREDEAVDRTKKEWIARYREFVSNLIYERNVLDKKFYVSIPASYLEMGLTTAQNLISGFKESSIEGIEKSVILEKALNILEPRRDHLISQFARIGLLARQLKTQEIIQLFYASYNPEATDGQQITDSRSYTTPLVQAQIRGVLMNDQSSSTPAMPAPVTTPEPTASAPAMSSTPPTSPVKTPSPTSPMSPSMSSPTPMTPPTPLSTPSVTSPSMPSITESPTTMAPAGPTPTPAAATIEPLMPPTKPPFAPSMSSPASSSTPSSSPGSTAPVVPATEAQAVINSTLQELTKTPAVEEEPPAPDSAKVEPIVSPPKPDEAPSS